MTLNSIPGKKLCDCPYGASNGGYLCDCTKGKEERLSDALRIVQSKNIELSNQADKILVQLNVSEKSA
jgi:hypothetical protein